MRGCRDLVGSFRRVEPLIVNYVDAHEFEIVAELDPVVGEPVIPKRSASAFTSSHLDGVLRNLMIAQIVVGGVSTSHCLDLSAGERAPES